MREKVSAGSSFSVVERMHKLNEYVVSPPSFLDPLHENRKYPILLQLYESFCELAKHSDPAYVLSDHMPLVHIGIKQHLRRISILFRTNSHFLRVLHYYTMLHIVELAWTVFSYEASTLAVADVMHTITAISSGW